MNELVADVKYYNGIITKPFNAECSINKTNSGLILTMEEEGVLHLPFSELTIKRRKNHI
ncbi:MAG: hypothetical protein IPJ26_01000 [Bacteroidetes bacterium]|nr:hypothetical protein [Bacteroidota bacterium]